MPYRFLEEIATADVAFEAWGETPGEMILAAAEATLQVMVEKPDTVAASCRRLFRVDAESLEMLLFEILQEIIFYKDAEQLLLRLTEVSIQEQEQGVLAVVEGAGERLDPLRHELNADVKAVTLHRFGVQQTARGWIATVVLDI